MVLLWEYHFQEQVQCKGLIYLVVVDLTRDLLDPPEIQYTLAPATTTSFRG